MYFFFLLLYLFVERQPPRVFVQCQHMCAMLSSFVGFFFVVVAGIEKQEFYTHQINLNINHKSWTGIRHCELREHHTHSIDWIPIYFIMIMIRLGDDGDEDENYIPVATESIAVHMCKVCRQTENCSKAKIVSNAVGPIAGAMISGSKCR